MAIPRSEQVDLSITPFYHCISRCVRQSYLCGIDHKTGKDYTYRKAWIVDRIKFLSNVFCIDVCAYAVMSNHYHIVLHVDKDKSQELSFDELLFLWEQIFPRDAQRLREELMTDSGTLQLTLDKKFRTIFTDISWFMRCLNEMIAKKSNKEDEVSGRFWDGRFKSQALLDEGAVLSAMVYVDLNPVRAGIADSPESSEFTSIQERLKCYVKSNNKNIIKKQPESLLPITTVNLKNKINFDLLDYFELVDVTGRLFKEGKRGKIAGHLASILERLQLTSEFWLDMVNSLENGFSFAVGPAHSIRDFTCMHQTFNSKQIKFSQRCYLDWVA